MLREARRFNRLVWAGMALVFWVSFGMGTVCAAEAKPVKYKEYKTGLYRDIFDQNFYYEGTNLLHLERLYRKLFRKKVRALNVNIFDEVPDSTFFTNRQDRSPMTPQEIERGYYETEGPSSTGELTVIRGKFEGMHPGFFVEDSRGDHYLLKFDPTDYLEVATGAEAVTSRLYYAIGYNVPQYTVYSFEGDRLKPAPDAMTLDDTGFKKILTEEKLEEHLLFLPREADGKYRASASKIMEGENIGNMPLTGRRKDDPNDPFDHQYRREIRALLVFSTWVANTDMRESNTMDLVVHENGQEIIKHYLIDFNACLGASQLGAKSPMFGHENTADWGTILKSIFSFGWWEKPWQKRWREAGEKPHPSPAIGYFDNRYFDPGKFKTQLPHFAYKDLTRADGFWAAKIMMSFSDDDVRAAVRAGKYSDPEDEDYMAEALIERRDLMGRYWFDQANPLDEIDLKGQKLVFEDLAVRHHFESKEGSIYRAEVIRKKGNKGEVVASLEVRSPEIDLSKWLSTAELDVLIRTKRQGSEKWSPFVLVEIRNQAVTGIVHED